MNATVSQSEFQASLKAVEYAICKDRVWPNLRGTWMEIKDGAMTLVAMDQRRMSICSIPVTHSGDFEILIPRKIAVQLRREMGKIGNCAIRMHPEQDKAVVEFEFGGTVIKVPSKGKACAGYPDWRKVVTPILASAQCGARINRKQLLGALMRAQTATDCLRGAVRLTHQGSALAVSGLYTGPENGPSEKIATTDDYEHEDSTGGADGPLDCIGINADFVIAALKALKGTNVCYGCRGPHHAFYLAEIPAVGAAQTYAIIQAVSLQAIN